MKFTAGQIPGTFTIDIVKAEDERGFFARMWCAREFREHGLPETLSQASISWNRERGTLRGMHLQRSPSQEAKVVRCVRGSIFDAIVDLRPESPTFLHAATFELSASNHRALYVPPGCAHGFQTLAPDTEVHYQMTDEYRADLSVGYRWNDPLFAISWPLEPTIMSTRDRNYPDLDRQDCNAFRSISPAG
ncbi:MAG: dTDP-4-dehydrorhamnose 3,5-epimerase family protein [Gammaproteobacteria bacterium]